MQIPIQKDIGEYQEKIVGKMSLRTLVCVAGGFACAIAVACIVYFAFRIDVGNATLPVMAAALPFWLAGFWRPYGMKLEEFAPLLIDHHLGPKRVCYESPSDFPALESTGPEPGKPSRKSTKRVKRKEAELREPSKQEERQRECQEVSS